MTPPVKYCGIFTQNHKETIAYIEDMVYTWWDQSPDAPPKSRPQELAPAPSLSVLTWNGPGFPSAIMQKFPIESDEHKALMDCVNEVTDVYPQTVHGWGSIISNLRSEKQCSPEPQASLISLSKEVRWFMC